MSFASLLWHVLFCFFQSSFTIGLAIVFFNQVSPHTKPISLDINECETNPCGPNTVCKDTVGSFVCSCKDSYTGDPFRGCVDVDECATLDKPCGAYAICENAAPGYNCLCPQGYRANPSPQIACEQVRLTEVANMAD